MAAPMKTGFFWGLVLFWGCASVCSEDLEAFEVYVVVLSQPNSHHIQRADEFKAHIEEQEHSIDVHFANQDFPNLHAWTLFPIIPELRETEKYSYKWVCICEEETRLDIERMVKILNTYNFHEPVFLGHALHDNEPAVIHHYSFHSPGDDPFLFPDTAAGVFLSITLVKDLVKRMSEKPKEFLPDFSIDPKHELAKYIYDEGKGVALKHNDAFCLDREESCATYVFTAFPLCEDVVKDEDIYIAVKTCEKFHKDRIPVIEKTWASETNSTEYLSEKEDPSIPTIKLDAPNTESGHCAKMMSILQRALKEHSDKLWYIIVDDDTLISVNRLRRLLGCYEVDEPVVLGERYGYLAAAGQGYDYVTGGGGLVLSHAALKMLIESGVCSCGADDAPDDMTLGMCFKRLGIPITHSPLFHQGRPEDYSDGYLSHQLPISFHKHLNTDPIRVYTEWLQETDAEKEYAQWLQESYKETHDEL